MRTFRRLVTGMDPQGRSILIEDARVEESGSAGNFNFWMTEPGAPSSEMPAALPFFPRTGQTIFRVFRIPPQAPAMTAAEIAMIAEVFFAELGDSACKTDTTRHPLMHATPTIDYVMLLAGKASLLLDEGEPIALAPLDAVVQRGTSHMWLNTGTEDTFFLIVMVGA